MIVLFVVTTNGNIRQKRWLRVLEYLLRIILELVKYYNRTPDNTKDDKTTQETTTTTTTKTYRNKYYVRPIYA